MTIDNVILLRFPLQLLPLLARIREYHSNLLGMIPPNVQHNAVDIALHPGTQNTPEKSESSLQKGVLDLRKPPYMFATGSEQY